jgi:multiple antibiotic resistance protein
MQPVHRFFLAFIPLFVAIDPVGMAAFFIGLTSNLSRERRRRITRHAAVTAALVALIFLFLGKAIFAALGITVADFQVAGGLILFILATRDLIQTAPMPDSDADDVGVVPLGMPLIAGPAMLTTLLITSQTVGVGITLLALAVNLGLLLLFFVYADRLARLVGLTGMRAISKIVSLLLAAIAISMIRRGWSGP